MFAHDTGICIVSSRRTNCSPYSVLSYFYSSLNILWPWRILRTGTYNPYTWVMIAGLCRAIAHYADILTMHAAVRSPTGMTAIIKFVSGSWANGVIHPDLAWAIGYVIGTHGESSSVAHLVAGCCCDSVVLAMFTDCPPYAILSYLQPPLYRGSDSPASLSVSSRSIIVQSYSVLGSCLRTAIWCVTSHTNILIMTIACAWTIAVR